MNEWIICCVQCFFPVYSGYFTSIDEENEKKNHSLTVIKTKLNWWFQSWFYRFEMETAMKNSLRKQSDLDFLIMCDVLIGANLGFMARCCDAIWLIYRIATTNQWNGVKHNSQQFLLCMSVSTMLLSILPLFMQTKPTRYFSLTYTHTHTSTDKTFQSVSVRRFGANKLPFLLLNVKRSIRISVMSTALRILSDFAYVGC